MDVLPHPLVVRLVLQILKRRVESYDDAEKQAFVSQLIARPNKGLAAAIAAAPAKAADVKTVETAIYAVLDKAPDQLSDAEWTRITRLFNLGEIPDLVTLAGYLGGAVDVALRGPSETWQILYVDLALQNWRLIPADDIVLHDRMDDDDSPFKKRDLLWVNADAQTARSEAPPRPEVQAKFLRGDFTRAGDLTPPPIGGARPAATGVFCDVITARCCTKTVRP
jgi:hypothetical protein